MLEKLNLSVDIQKWSPKITALNAILLLLIIFEEHLRKDEIRQERYGMAINDKEILTSRVEVGNNCHSNENMKVMRKKVNWKAPSLDYVQGYWLKRFKSIR